MKKSITLFIVFFFSTLILAISPSVPQKLSYQAIIRNSNDKLVTNQLIGIRISIIYNTPTGAIAYAETQTPTTNANGLISIAIGTGTPVTGTFTTIEWTAGPHFIKTEIDPTGGTAYSITSTSELLSVPYAITAMYAKNVETIPNNSVTSSKIVDGTIVASDLADNSVTTLKIADGSIATSDLANSTVTADKLGNLAVTETKIGSRAVTAPKLASMGATSGQVLSYSGTAWTPQTIASNPWQPSGGNIYFNTGRVGIGTTIPNTYLHVVGGSEIARFESTATSKWIALYQDNTRKGMLWNTNNDIKLVSDAGGVGFRTDGIDRITITADGKTGIGDTTPDATLDVQGTVIIGAAGKIFSEIREITATTVATGHSTALSFPSGYSMSNTRILSAEINFSGNVWVTLGMFNVSSDYTVGCSLASTGIHISYPDLDSYHSRAIRILLMKVE